MLDNRCCGGTVIGEMRGAKAGGLHTVTGGDLVHFGIVSGDDCAVDAWRVLRKLDCSFQQAITSYAAQVFSWNALDPPRTGMMAVSGAPRIISVGQHLLNGEFGLSQYIGDALACKTIAIDHVARAFFHVHIF